MKPIEPQIIDGMPREVATAILSEPKATLSNRWRKVCMRARDEVFVSSSPIVRPVDEVTQKRSLRFYTEREPIDTETKTARRFSVATLAQLGRWCSRAIARRAVVQRKYLALSADNTPRNNALRELYSALANRLDIIRDCAEYEINARREKAKGIVAIRNGFKSSFMFLRSADFRELQ